MVAKVVGKKKGAEDTVDCVLDTIAAALKKGDTATLCRNYGQPVIKTIALFLRF